MKSALPPGWTRKMSSPPVTGAGVFLHNGRKVLLVHEKSSGLWGFPKGCRNAHETNCECWQRELFEETGLRLQKPREQRNFDVLRYNITEVQLPSDYLPPVSAGPEVSSVRWFHFRQALSLPLNAITKRVLQNHLPRDPYSAFTSCRRLLKVRQRTPPSYPVS